MQETQKFITNLLIAMALFIVGQQIIKYMGQSGIWLIVALLVIFYTGWWVFYQRGKKKE